MKKHSINDLHVFAAAKGGLLLSSSYPGNRIPLLWSCSEGHQWYARWNNIKNHNTWCAVCIGQVKPTITDLQRHAKSLGGTLLSTVYINKSEKLMWECNKHHSWSACWDSLSNMNTWCPECKVLKNERLCIETASSIFGLPFIKTRIYYSKENKRKFFEFDGYNSDKRIAIEYNGIQHYIFSPFLHKTETQFIEQKQRDTNKRKYCADNNIHLIEVPYTSNIEEVLLEHKELIWL